MDLGVIEKIAYACDYLIRFFYLAFPDYKDFPAGFAKLTEVSLVTGDVSGAFLLPEFDVGARPDSAIAAAVHVPETAVNKDYFVVADENKVGMAGEVFSVQRIAIAHAVDE